MPCSLCKETGHNRTTCQRKYSTKVSIERKLSDPEDRESVPISKIEHLKKVKSNDNNAKNVLPEKIDHTAHSLNGEDKKKERNKARTHSVPSVKISNIIVNIEKPCENDNSQKPHLNRGVNVDKNGIKKKTKLVSPISKTEKPTDSEALRVKQNKSISDSESPKKPVSNSWKNIKIRDGDKDILCAPAMTRFLEGPSEDEGKGYIYMYTYCTDSSVTKEQRSTYKIGMTKYLPERRIQRLGNTNKESYIKLYSVDVAWRRLTENIIHKQLTAKGYRCPRKDGEGGTEWFQGKKDEMINVINLVIRFINVYALPLQQ